MQNAHRLSYKITANERIEGKVYRNVKYTISWLSPSGGREGGRETGRSGGREGDW